MNDARALAAAVLIALAAGTAHGQSGGGQTETGQTETGQTEAGQSEAGQSEAGQSEAGQSDLAPDRAVTPAERPEDAPALAPAEGTPAPAPRPAAASAPAPAAEPPPKTAPVPPAEPEAPAQAPTPEQAPEAPATAPVPAEDPDPGAEAPATAPQPAEPPVPEQLAEDDAGLAACLGSLQALGAGFERVDSVSDEGGACGIANPIRVAEIVPGVALEPAGVMRCATANALADWVATFVLPASRLLPEQGRLAAVEHASTYVCRRIGGDGKRSQHAFGNAVDVMAFRFVDAPTISVEPREREGTAAEAFQRTARASACLLFTTVLGPGQEDHNDHLHLDIDARESGYRLCQ